MLNGVAELGKRRSLGAGRRGGPMGPSSSPSFWPLPAAAAGQSHTYVFLFSISVPLPSTFSAPQSQQLLQLQPYPGVPSQHLFRPPPPSVLVAPPPRTCPKVTGLGRGGLRGSVGERGSAVGGWSESPQDGLNGGDSEPLVSWPQR